MITAIYGLSSQKKICGSTDRTVNELPRNELVSTLESASSVSNTGRLENV